MDILEYLKNTEKIKNIVKKIQARNPSAGIPSWILAPWSVEALKQNLGDGVEEEIFSMQAEGLLEMHHEVVDGHSVVLIDRPRIDMVKTDSPERTKMKRSISGVMNLYILSYLYDRMNVENSPVKLEDALFDLKNGVMLPDDFMPEYLIGNIEGSGPELEPEEIVREIQPFQSITTIFCYFEYNEQKTGSLSMLYPGPATKIPLTREEMREKLTESFKKLQENPGYGDFEMSRILNRIIYNMEQRNTMEFRRPLPPPNILSRLVSMGIVRESSGKYMVSQETSIEKIKLFREEFKKKASVLASEWLQKTII